MYALMAQHYARRAFAFLIGLTLLLSGCAINAAPTAGWGFPFKTGTAITLGCLGLHDDNIYADGAYSFKNAHPQGLQGPPPFKCPPDMLSEAVDPTHANEASLDLVTAGVGVPVIPLAGGTVLVADESCHLVVVDHGNAGNGTNDHVWVAYLHIDVRVAVHDPVTTSTTLGTTAAPHTSTCENSDAPHVHLAFLTGSGTTGTYVSMVGTVLCGFQVIKNAQYPIGALEDQAHLDHVVIPGNSFTVPDCPSSSGSMPSAPSTSTPIPTLIPTATALSGIQPFVGTWWISDGAIVLVINADGSATYQQGDARSQIQFTRVQGNAAYGTVISGSTLSGNIGGGGLGGGGTDIPVGGAITVTLSSPDTLDISNGWTLCPSTAHCAY